MVFIDSSVDGAGNVFLYNTASGQITPLYYTTVDSLTDSFDQEVSLSDTTLEHAHSAVTTRDGIYYVCQTGDDYNQGWALYQLPESSGVYESPFKDIIIGDADGDGKVTINDATMIQKYLVEFDMPDNFVLKACDVNGDGKVTISDATDIQRFIAEMDAPEGIGTPIA